MQADPRVLLALPELVWDYAQNHLSNLWQIVRTLLNELGLLEG